MSDLRRRDPWSEPPPSPLLNQGGGVYVPRRVQGIQHLARWKNDPEPVETLWLRRVVGGLFQGFVTMALPGQPAAEMLPLTAQLWVDILADMNLTEADTERIHAGGRRLLRDLEDWPQVKHLIEKMPGPGTRDRGPVTTEAGPTERDREAGREALKKLREMF